MQLKWFDHYNLLIFDELDSTNLEAKRLIQAGVTGNFVIWAECQTCGKGRYGRTWISPPGNLYLSIILDSDAFHEKQAELCFVTSLAVYDAIHAKALSEDLKLDIALKWPNDVMVGGAKISGILLESIKTYNGYNLVIGIGLNVRHHPDNIERLVTSMYGLGMSVDAGEMIDRVMSSFMYYYAIWKDSGFKKIRNLWLQKAYNPYDVMTVSDGRRSVSGVFQGIDHSGAIMLKTESGEVHTLSTGEVFFDSP
jgi:BirA family biotin operon repressor/biotin-[acetyl-CoA-carboxylase] ligase